MSNYGTSIYYWLQTEKAGQHLASVILRVICMANIHHWTTDTRLVRQRPLLFLFLNEFTDKLLEIAENVFCYPHFIYFVLYH